MIEHTLSNNFPEIRDAIRALCAEFPDEYFRKIDEQRAYPETFVDALTKAGWLAALIPQEYGGSGLGLTEASVIMEEINRCGGNSGACHGQMYNMGTLLRHGSQAQKEKYLPRIASGEALVVLAHQERQARYKLGVCATTATQAGSGALHSALPASMSSRQAFKQAETPGCRTPSSSHCRTS